jgi:hypothetical protein
MAKDSVFAVLSTIDCKEHIEKKKDLSYLSWAWAWQILKEKFPTAFYTIYENKDGLNYHTDGKTCWVKTGVTVEGIEHIEYLPIMDYRNASIPVDKVVSTDVNKTIQRSLTKAVARHGLGLYIYAGEDIPDPHDDELRAMVHSYKQPALSAPKSEKEMMHQNHPKWQAMLESILAGKTTLEKVKAKYCFPDADEIAAKEWLISHQL